MQELLPPSLLPVPWSDNYFQALRIKATSTGITILKTEEYKKRYVGSKHYFVDKVGRIKTRVFRAKGASENNYVRSKFHNPYSGQATVKDNTAKTYTIKKTEVRLRILAMVEAQPDNEKELYFWTVTFPAGINDNDAYRCFNTWLTKLRQKKMINNYLWVAERQKNGTVHYHICIPHKMKVVEANKEMRICLMTLAKNKELKYPLHKLAQYNGVDIAKGNTFDKKTKQWKRGKKAINFANGKRGRRALLSYITKYVSKNDSTDFTHLAWHNSRGFSRLFTGITFTFEEFTERFKLKDFVLAQSITGNDFYQFHPWLDGSPPFVRNELQKLNAFIITLN